jgi:hypothetical protein
MTLRSKKLIAIAKVYMNRSNDPVHDTHHVERVLGYAQQISAGYHLSTKEQEALTLAVWWHDASRSVLPKTSFVLMYFFDDLLSALMLWAWTIRYGLFGSVAGMATRIIFCKSKSFGSLFIRIFLSKRSKLLLQILEDADALDMLSVERISILCSMSSESRLNYHAYKVVCTWWTAKDRMKLYTREAKALLIKLLETFMTWLEHQGTIAYHTSLFGDVWTKRIVARWKLLEQSLLQAT